MRASLRPCFLGFAFLSAWLVPRLAAQASAPQAYTLEQVSLLTEASMLMGQAANLTVYRDGSKEVVDLKIPPSPAHPQEFHQIFLFDFEAHKAYVSNPISHTCFWINYVSQDAPANYDPITGSAHLMADLVQHRPTVLGTESINGMPAEVEEVSIPGQGTAKIWIATEGNFLLKYEGPGPDGKQHNWLEIKRVSFAKPPASHFVAPADCTQAQGEWSDTELHAQGEAQLSMSPHAADGLRTGGQKSGQAPAPPAPAPKSVAGSKKVYTNDDLQVAAGGEPAAGVPASPILLPRGTRVSVKYEDGSEVKLKAEEQVAFVFLVSMEDLEGYCWSGAYLGRACSLDELIQGLRAKTGGTLGLSQNPNQDPNYRYELTISSSGKRYQLEAVPRRAGLGGFLFVGEGDSEFGDFYYNPGGVATTEARKLGDMNVSGDNFKRHDL